MKFWQPILGLVIIMLAACSPALSPADPTAAHSPTAILTVPPAATVTPTQPPPPTGTATSTETATPQPSATPTPSSTPSSTLYPRPYPTLARALTRFEISWLGVVLAPLLTDPDFPFAELRWENEDYYQWCEVIYRYLDNYGFGPYEMYWPGDEYDRGTELYFIYYELANGLGAEPDGDPVCPQFAGAYVFGPKSTPVPTPYPQLELSDFEIDVLYSYLFSIITDPLYPGDELTFESEDYWLWCQVLKDYAGTYGDYARWEHREDLQDYLKKWLADDPIAISGHPICPQFSAAAD